MKKSRRMQTLVKLARIEEEHAVLQRNEAQNAYSAHLGKLRELESFYKEYKQRMDTLGGAGMDMGRLNEYRGFVRQIDQALKIQRQLVAEARGVLERHDESWKAARVHHKALDNYQSRCRKEEDLESAKREQKESDERAMRARSLY